MMLKAVKEHFKLEKAYLTQRPRIKPLTLFFIDDIEGYRDGNDIAGSLKTKFEAFVLAEANNLLKTEKDEFYRNYLEKLLRISLLFTVVIFRKITVIKMIKLSRKSTKSCMTKSFYYL